MPTRLELVITARADQDLAEIYRWSADRFGDGVATEYLRAIDKACRLLCRLPRLGAAHPHTAEPVRVYPCRSHRIFYDVDERAVTIVRVLHKAQSVEGKL